MKKACPYRASLFLVDAGLNFADFIHNPEYSWIMYDTFSLANSKVIHKQGNAAFMNAVWGVQMMSIPILCSVLHSIQARAVGLFPFLHTVFWGKICMYDLLGFCDFLMHT